MKQALHIFLKDARRFWPEILISLAIVAAFIRIYPHEWMAANLMHRAFMTGFFAGDMFDVLSQALVVLIPLSWWLLITRVVHAERLVGDSQFWLTRPYEWKRLLGAKVLFLAVFICLPIFVAQSLLLLEAGFHPLSYIPGLLYSQLLLTGVLVLPLAALSTLTSSFAKMTLAVLGVVLLIAGIAALGSLAPSDSVGSVASPLGDKLSFAALMLFCGAAIVAQYAIRKTWFGWSLLAVLPILLTAFAFGDPDAVLMNRAYPPLAANATAPVQLQYLPDSTHAASTNTTNDAKELEIYIPLHSSGVAPGYTTRLEGVKATIDAPDGSHWESPWQAVYNQYLLSDTEETFVRFRIRRAVYDKFKTLPVTLRLSFALTRAKADTEIQVPLPAHDFFVAGFGMCSPRPGWLNRPSEIAAVACRAALRQPDLSYVSVLWSEQPCSTAQSNSSSGVLGATWAGSFEQDPADFGITSVWNTPLNFSNSWAGYRQGTTGIPRHLCVGLPITFTRYRLDGRSQTAILLQDFHMPKFSVASGFVFVTQH